MPHHLPNNAGGQYVTWNTTSYTLSGTLEINCWSSSGVYNVYVNGAQVAHTPSSRDWISCGSHTDINEIQFGGTSHNSSTGLGSAGIIIYEIRVAGKTLIDSGTTPPNAPTLASTLRANPEAGFSIVTYSGGGSGSANSDSGMSFAHGLNSSPDFVIVKNIEQIKFTGKKFQNKKYYRHTGHPGGIKETTPQKLSEKKPGEALKLAVKRMLPGGVLGKKQLTKLTRKSVEEFVTIDRADGRAFTG